MVKLVLVACLASLLCLAVQADHHHHEHQQSHGPLRLKYLMYQVAERLGKLSESERISKVADYIAYLQGGSTTSVIPDHCSRFMNSLSAEDKAKVLSLLQHFSEGQGLLYLIGVQWQVAKRLAKMNQADRNLEVGKYLAFMNGGPAPANTPASCSTALGKLTPTDKATITAGLRNYTEGHGTLYTVVIQAQIYERFSHMTEAARMHEVETYLAFMKGGPLPANTPSTSLMAVSKMTENDREHITAFLEHYQSQSVIKVQVTARLNELNAADRITKVAHYIAFLQGGPKPSNIPDHCERSLARLNDLDKADMIDFLHRHYPSS